MMVKSQLQLLRAGASIILSFKEFISFQIPELDTCFLCVIQCIHNCHVK